jgi:hypothetical protein
MIETANPPVVLRFGAGIDNQSVETEMPAGTLRVCENLDISRGGSLLSRLGLRSMASGNYHSAYTPSHERFILLVKDGTLGVLSGDEFFSSLVALTRDATVQYAELNGDVFWMTPYQRGRVDSSGASGYWGLNTPFIVSAVPSASGGLYAGDYQVTLTAVYQGLESGAPAPTVVTVPNGGGISVTVPVGGTFNIYVSNANGTAIELRQAATATSGQTVVVGTGQRGRLLDSLLAIPPFYGTALCVHKGRLLVADGSTLWFTSERSPHWLFPHTGYVRESASITGIGAVEDGIYVGTAESIVFLQGSDPTSMARRVVSADAGMVMGTVCTQLPFDVATEGAPLRQAAWLDTDGYPCIGKPGGVVVRPTLNRYSAGALTSGMGAYRVREGIRQLLFAEWSGPIGANVAPNDAPIVTEYPYGTSLEEPDLPT